MNEVLQAISTVGFPIVACGALFWLQYNTGKTHHEESQQMSEAINNNTLVIQKLLDKLDSDAEV